MKNMMIHLVLVVLCTPLHSMGEVLTCSGVLQGKVPENKYFSETTLKAQDIFKNQGVEVAISFLENLISNANKNSDFKSVHASEILFLAQLYEKNQDSQNQIRTLLLFIEKKSSQVERKIFIEALGRLAEAYEQLSRNESDEAIYNAIQTRQAQLELDPNHYQALKKLVDNYLKLDKKREALPELDKLYKLAEQNGFERAQIRALRNKATIEIKLKDFAAATQTLTKLFDKHKDQQWALQRLINIKMWEQDYTTAVNYALGYIRVTDSKSNAAYLQLIDAYMGLKQWDEAEKIAFQKMNEAKAQNKAFLADKFAAKLTAAKYRLSPNPVFSTENFNNDFSYDDKDLEEY